MSSIRETIVNGIFYTLEQVPIAGKAVEILENIVFQPDHWEEIRANAETLVGQKMSDQLRNSMQATLQGLSENLREYVKATKLSKGNPEYIGDKFSIAKGQFNQAVPSYQTRGNQLLLLPMFAQVANMHLTLLREGAIHGREWHFTEQVLEDLRRELQAKISDYIKYVGDTYNDALSSGLAQAKTNIDKFNAQYGLSREITLNVLEYAELWPFFDLSSPGSAPTLNLEREIYSDAFGSSATVLTPPPAPTEKMTGITVWNESVGFPQWDRIDTLQIRYGRTDGPKMGGAGIIPSGNRPGIGTPQKAYWKEIRRDLGSASVTRYAVATFAAANVHRNISGLELTFNDGTYAAYGVLANPTRPDVRSLPVMSGYYMSSITMVGAGTPHSLTDAKAARAIFFGFKREAFTTPKPGELRVFRATGEKAGHPAATVIVPSGYKVVGGGARVNWSGAGNLLTASFPRDVHTWEARSKDHGGDYVDIATIDVWAIAIFDPMEDWDVQIFSSTSTAASHPSTAAAVPLGYVLTGGGAESHWKAAGSLLTESYPNPQVAGSWVASSKDHIDAETTQISSYAIGIRPIGGVPAPTTKIFSRTSAAASHPSIEISPDPGYVLVGGGAKVNWSGQGNLLTASYPGFESGKWKAASKDHVKGDPCTITAYAIGLPRAEGALGILRTR